MLLGHFEKMNVKMPNVFLWTSLYTMTRMIMIQICAINTLSEVYLNIYWRFTQILMIRWKVGVRICTLLYPAIEMYIMFRYCRENTFE